jgi:hypothetical protein
MAHAAMLSLFLQAARGFRRVTADSDPTPPIGGNPQNSLIACFKLNFIATHICFPQTSILWAHRQLQISVSNLH